MATYGPHNLRWLAGPEGADIIGSVGPDPAIVEYPGEIFGTLMEDLGKSKLPNSAKENIKGLYSHYRPFQSAANFLKELADRYITEGADEYKLRQAGVSPPSKLKDLGMHGANQVMNLIEALMGLAGDPAASQVGNKVLPNLARGVREDANR